jgi:hypothetical protein
MSNELISEEEKTDIDERYIYYLGDLEDINVYVLINNNITRKRCILEVKQDDYILTNLGDFFKVEEIQKYNMKFGDDNPEEIIGFVVTDDTYEPEKKFIMQKNGRIYNFPPLNNTKSIDEKNIPSSVFKIIKKK